MSPRDWPARIEDILGALENAQAYIRGLTYADFAADIKTMHATAFEVGIVGEAASRIPADVRQLYPQIP